MAPPRADRNRRRHRTLELPADDGGVEARACSGRGQRPGAEAVRADAAHDSAIRTVRRRHPAGRRAQRHHRGRCSGRRGDRQASRCPARVADRRRRDGQDHRANGCGHAEARPPRARRQGARDRVRRRGSRSRRSRRSRSAAYWNSGQDCTAASRVVAGPKIYDQLLEELVPAVESLHVGDPAEGDEIEMGP